MTRPKLSVITPVYNGERFIEACMRNVVEQNCNDVEHIIVDDGSSDRTRDIITDYAERHPHVHAFFEEHRGQSDAMNKGITMARAGVISFLNVDDFYEPGALKHAIELFETLPEPTLLAGNCNVRDKNDNIKYVNRPKKLGIVELLLSQLNPFPANPSAYFYHKSLHDKIGPYRSDEHYAMDLYFILDAVQAANTVYVDETWGNFRLIEGAKTFEDIKKGIACFRQTRILNTYRRRLPFPKKLELAVKYTVYFAQHPIKFARTVKYSMLYLTKGRKLVLDG